MEFKEEPVDCYEETVIIKQEPVCINPQNIKEEHDWATKHPEVSSTDAVPTLKQEQFEALLASSLNDIGEVEASDYFVNTNDIIVNIKREIPEFDIPVAELLTAHCDLPTIKSEHLDYYDQPCSSKQAQELPQQNKRKSAPKKVGKTKRKRKYPCPICRKRPLNQKHLNLHFKTYVICGLCGYLFIQKNEFLTHYSKHLTKRPIIKRKVNVKINLKGNKYSLLAKSKQNKLPKDDDIKCKLCCRIFTKKHNLMRHLNSGSCQRKKFHCEVCFKNLTTKKGFLSHTKLHTGKDLFECHICSKKLTTKQGLSHHTKLHTCKDLFECHICSKKFVTKRGFLSHTKLHTDKDLFECQMCFTKFTTKRGFSYHTKLCPCKDLFTCKICFQKCYSESGLNSHEKFHDNRLYEVKVNKEKNAKTYYRKATVE